VWGVGECNNQMNLVEEKQSKAQAAHKIPGLS